MHRTNQICIRKYCHMSDFFIYNDKYYKEGTAVISQNNRSFKFGDGLFETLKITKGKIQLSEYHFKRLYSGMETLQFQIPKHFTPDYLQGKIVALFKKNKHIAGVRIRLMIFRGDGGLYDPKDHFPNYIIQTWDIENYQVLNPNGLHIDIYHDAIKSCDKFANLKCNNYLPYVMAALHAKNIKVNDCILLNSFNRVCDTSIANIFIIKKGEVYTPPLSEGCVAGVIRQFLLEKLNMDFTIIEKPISVEELENADEVFVTNSIRGIRWVNQFRDSKYSNTAIKKIHKIFLKTLY